MITVTFSLLLIPLSLNLKALINEILDQDQAISLIDYKLTFLRVILGNIRVNCVNILFFYYACSICRRNYLSKSTDFTKLNLFESKPKDFGGSVN